MTIETALAAANKETGQRLPIDDPIVTGAVVALNLLQERLATGAVFTDAQTRHLSSRIAGLVAGDVRGLSRVALIRAVAVAALCAAVICGIGFRVGYEVGYGAAASEIHAADGTIDWLAKTQGAEAVDDWRRLQTMNPIVQVLAGCNGEEVEHDKTGTGCRVWLRIAGP